MIMETSPSHIRFGWFCSYTPIEIILAAGYIPMRLDAGDTLISRANPLIYQQMCPYIRSVFDLSLKKSFDPLEGAVFVKCCDGMLRLYDLWKAHIPEKQAYLLPLPKIQSEEAIGYFALTLRKFAKDLEDKTGKSISAKALQQAITHFNTLRKTVQNLYQWRIKHPEKMSYADMRSLIREALISPTSEYLKKLDKALKEFKDAPGGTNPSSSGKVLITSTVLDQTGIIRLIEGAGLTVIGDDHCLGRRHFDTLVSEDGDPYYNLAYRYLNRWPCPRMKSSPSHIDRLLEEVTQTRAQGVIYVGLKYCDQASYDQPRLQAKLKALNIPLLYLENDYTEGGLAQLKIRIEAFAETLTLEV
jgi:bcr-type benzoyl-CoA reductase subunit C